MGDPAEDERLSAEDAAALERGVALFNEGRYFESHDVLEELWRGTRGYVRDFLKGLIQLAVGCYHLESGNRSGAESQLGKALGNLESYPDRYLGVDAGGAREVARRMLASLEGGGLRHAPRIAMGPPR